MKVSLMRHGEASFEAASDTLRPLTQRGREQSADVIALADSKGWNPDLLWVSTLLRAQQTMAYAEQSLERVVEKKRFLTPESQAEKCLREIAKLENVSHLLIVAHQPFLGSVFSLCVHGNLYEAHPFVTSEMVTLRTDVAAAGLFELESVMRP